jgi:hypothetical protein
MIWLQLLNRSNFVKKTKLLKKNYNHRINFTHGNDKRDLQPATAIAYIPLQNCNEPSTNFKMQNFVLRYFGTAIFSKEATPGRIVIGQQ